MLGHRFLPERGADFFPPWCNSSVSFSLSFLWLLYSVGDLSVLQSLYHLLFSSESHRKSYAFILILGKRWWSNTNKESALFSIIHFKPRLEKLSGHSWNQIRTHMKPVMTNGKKMYFGLDQPQTNPINCIYPEHKLVLLC